MNLTDWTREDSIQAQREGWDLFVVDHIGRMFLERLDEAERFPDDNSAIDFVVGEATQGSALHQKALLVAGSFDPLVNGLLAL